jgi:hypothetical protein
MSALKVPWEKEGFWQWWARTSPPNARVKDYIQQIEAPIIKKGQSNRTRKARKPTTIYRNPFIE